MNNSLFNPVMLIVTVCLLISCSVKEDETPPRQLYAVCIELKKELEILPFPSVRSIPGYRPAEPRSLREPDAMSLFSTIEYVVFRKESGAIVKHRVLTEDNSDDFGAYVYDELEAGVYEVALLAHSSSGLALDGSIAAGAEVTDSFYAVKEITVGTETEGLPENVVLKRIVARVEFAGNKRVPYGAAKFILEIWGFAGK